MTTDEKQPARMLTMQEAAERMGVTYDYVKRLLAQRRIPFTKYGEHRQSPVRISEHDIDDFLAAGRVEAAK